MVSFWILTRATYFDMRNLCNSCSKRLICVELCPEAELYINQDHVNKKYATFTELNTTDSRIENLDYWGVIKKPITKKQLTIYIMHEYGLSSRKIARALEVDDSYIRRVIRTVKERL